VNEVYRGNFLAGLFLEEMKAKKDNAAHTSQWLPYIEALPRGASKEFLINYTDAELKELDGCDRIMAEVDHRRKIIKEEYDHLSSSVPEFKSFEF